MLKGEQKRNCYRVVCSILNPTKVYEWEIIALDDREALVEAQENLLKAFSGSQTWSVECLGPNTLERVQRRTHLAKANNPHVKVILSKNAKDRIDDEV